VGSFKRTSQFLQQPIFNTYHNEHDMLRWVRATAQWSSPTQASGVTQLPGRAQVVKYALRVLHDTASHATSTASWAIIILIVVDKTSGVQY
jgi:hypothetical protein